MARERERNIERESEIMRERERAREYMQVCVCSHKIPGDIERVVVVCVHVRSSPPRGLWEADKAFISVRLLL